jgi:hypothetical protein
VVGARVDALTLAYRVRISDDVIEHLEAQAKVAREHGRARVRVGKLWGEMKYSRAARCWNVTNVRFRTRIDLAGPGKVEHPAGVDAEGNEVPAWDEPGWTLETIWSAQALAEIGELGEVVDRTRAVAESLASSDSRVLLGGGEIATCEVRVRRFDLAADVAGWEINPDDASHVVRRSRAKQSQHPREVHEEGEGVTLHEQRAISGLTVCPGGAFMARLYNKRLELADPAKEPVREAEEARWRAGGWDGESPVTRVELQIRGEAVKELGLRDPENAYDPQSGTWLGRIEQAIDRVWQRCLYWLRLVLPADPRATRCPDDPRWALLRHVTFHADRPPEAHGRKRVRTGATSEQTLGCVLSLLGARDLLVPRDERPPEAPVIVLERVVSERVREMFAAGAEIVSQRLLGRWGPGLAVAHLAVTENAVRERFLTA